MSEWVVLHCLMHLRQARRYERQQRERVWDDDDDQPAAARRARRRSRLRRTRPRRGGRSSPRSAFQVAAWSASAKTAPGIACFDGAAGLDAMLARSDILVCLLPLTAATRGILNAALFAKLPRDGRLGGAILLNAGRGGLQVEADIVAALDSGALKGASLDVFETEPLPARLAAVEPSRGVRHAAQRRDVPPRFHRPRRRRANPRPRARRAAAPCGRSRQGVLTPSPACGRGRGEGESTRAFPHPAGFAGHLLPQAGEGVDLLALTSRCGRGSRRRSL